MVDQVDPFLTAQPYHLRVGWALTEGFSPYPGGGEGWGGNGVGDDLYSYGFDGLHLWSGGCVRRRQVVDEHQRFVMSLTLCLRFQQDAFHDMLPRPMNTLWLQRTWSAAVWI